jgi:hypothetical protein
MASYGENKQFVTDNINQYDVINGRGSGPYEQLGNIHFRDLVATRKLEYLSLTPRDTKMKNKIAQEIIDVVRSRGGRFLRKIQVDNQTNERVNKDLYELVDEATALEKAKQALRQNRTEFIKTATEKNKVGGPPPASDALQEQEEVAASMTASSSAPTKPTHLPSPQLLPPRPALSSSSHMLDHCHGGGNVTTNGCTTLGFAGITGPPPDPTTPEEWEAFHAYWSGGNEPNRRLWDQLQLQQQQLDEHYQQRHRQHQQENDRQQFQKHQEQLYQQQQQQYQQLQQQQQQLHCQIPKNAASSSHYYSTEQELWGQKQLQQEQYMPNTITSNINNNMAESSSIPTHVGAAAPGMGGETPMTSHDSIQSQQDLLNYFSRQQNCFDNNGVSNQGKNNYSNQYQGYHQQQQTAPIVAPEDNNRAMKTAYMAYVAQLEQRIISENSRFHGGHGNSVHSSSSYMPSGQDFDELEAQHLPVAADVIRSVATKGQDVSIRSVATKGHERNNSFDLKSAGWSHDDDHDSFFSGIKDMSLPSVSLGEISDFGKHSFTNRSVILEEVIEDASERFDVQDIIQEVSARVPSQRQESGIKPKANGTKRRSLSSYYREVNAAVAATYGGRRSIGDLDTSFEANNDTMDNMSCSLQSMSLAESKESKSSSEQSPPIC